MSQLPAGKSEREGSEQVWHTEKKYVQGSGDTAQTHNKLVDLGVFFFESGVETTVL